MPGTGYFPVSDIPDAAVHVAGTDMGSRKADGSSLDDVIRIHGNVLWSSQSTGRDDCGREEKKKDAYFCFSGKGRKVHESEFSLQFKELSTCRYAKEIIKRPLENENGQTRENVE